MNKRSFPLHPAQKDVFIDQLLDVESSHYNIGGYIKLEGTLDKEKFFQAVKSAPQVFDAYKMRFNSDTSNPSFFIEEDYEEMDVEELDFTKEEDPKGIAMSWMQKRFNTAFDIKEDEVLFEHVLIKVAEGEHWFFCKYHHLITDGFGFIVWVQYLATRYKSLTTGDSLSISYPSYIEEVLKAADYYKSADYEQEGEYWKEKIKSKPERLFQKRHKSISDAGRSSTFIMELPEEKRKLFEELQLSNKVGLQQLTIAALLVYFGKTSNKSDFVFGIPLHKRGSKRLRNIIGMFSGIQPFTGSYSPKTILSDLLKEISQTQRKDYRYQNYLIGDLSRHFQTTTFGEGYLTDIVVNYEPLNFESDFGAKVAATVLRLANEHEVTPLQMVWRDYGKNRPLQVHVHYKNEYFNNIEIELLSERIIYLIEQFSEKINSEVGLLEILPEAEFKLVQSFNTAGTSSVTKRTIVDLFEEQVLKTPDATAVIFEDQQVTYAELNQKADLLATFLRSKGVKEETCVPICIERSIGLMVGIMGILKAGGAYVPIDPDYPAERITFMLEDVAAGLIVTSQDSVSKLPVLNKIEIIKIDSDWDDVKAQSKEVSKTSLQASNLAYIIYTSGSTGRPKGVMVEHGNVVSLVKDVDYVSLTNKDILLSTGSPSFDATTFEYWGMLLNGGQLVLSTENTLLDAQLLKLEITKRKVTKMWFTSSWFNQLVDTDITVFAPLRTILAGGEKLSETHIEKVRKRFPSIDIINGYGPTENTTFSLTCNITALENVDSIPIGRPLSGRTAYIVNGQGELLPIGEPGEILLGGAGLSRGYLNQQELTSEKFIENQFSNDRASKLYRTGDLGRWLPDGNIEYLGRIDDQVKIRGYRIELGEIESVLLECSIVSQAVVVAKEESNGAKRLIGYVVAKEHFDKQVVTTHLHERLPDYMVPAIWVELSTLPLTSNGKVDKRALPDPVNEQLSSNEYVAPTNDVQKTLAGIWESLLGIERVGILDNFFELGGDSILTIQVVSRANGFGFNLQPKDIFIHQTISRLSGIISERSGLETTAEQGELKGEAGLLPIQQWFLKQEDVDRSHYNQSVLLLIKKSVTQELLEEAIKHLTAFHDALRFRYYRQNNQWQQEYGTNTGTVSIETILDPNSIDSDIQAISSRYQQSLDIENGRLFESVLIKTPPSETDNRLLMVVHHLAVDGVSWRIILEHLDLLLTQLSNNEIINLGKKSSSYRQWFDALKQYGNSKHLLAQSEYWRNVVKNYQPLKTEKVFSGQVLAKDRATIQVHLPADQTQHLLQSISGVYHTDINDILLAALALCLCEWNGSDKVVIGLEGHGREHISEGIDTTKTVGWFTNLYPVLLEVRIGKDNDSLIKSTKEQLRQIPDKGLGYGVLKYINEEQTLNDNAGLDVVFNYLGQVDNLNKEGQWFRLSGEGAKASRSEQQILQEKLSIDAIVQSGRLVLDWGYSARHFNAETVEELASDYIDILNALITHCLALKNLVKSVKTPFDFGLGVEVHYSELDQFLEETIDGKKRKDLVEGIYRLSGTQQGMLFHSLYNKEAGAYIEQLICDLIAPDIRAVQKSWQIVIDQHTILRSAFYHDTFSIPVQCVFKQAELPVEVLDFQHLTAVEQLLAVDNFKSADRSKGFDFKEAPLIRLALIRLSTDKYKMVWTSHHLLFDGWSLPILVEDFLKNYEVVINGEQPSVKEDKFEDFIRYIEQRDKHQEVDYWSNYLKDVQESTMLPFIAGTVDRNRGVGEFKTEYFSIDTESTLKVKNFAKQQRITVNTVMQGVWSYLLHKYTGNDTITCGVTVSGRPDDLPNVEQRVGMFINTVPLKSQLREGDEIVEWLRSLQEDQVSSRQHQFTSLHEIQSLTAIEGDLFDTTLTFQNYPINNILTSYDWKLKIENISVEEQNNFPLSLTISINDEISVRAIYNATLLKDEYVFEIERHFKNVLQQVVSNENITVNKIRLLTPLEEQILLNEHNNTEKKLPVENSLVSLIENQSEQRADAAALILGNAKATYKELNERSNQLAHYLIAIGVKAETLVPICIEPGFEMIVGILGILKAGGAYVPIDPEYPLERIQYILEDTSAEIVVSNHASSENLQKIAGINVVEVGEANVDMANQPIHNPKKCIEPHHLAYVIYTSGSTGKPKGVMIEHGSLLNYLLNGKTNYINAASGNTGTFLHLSYTFDASVTGIFMPLLAGKSIVISSKRSHEVFKDLNLVKYAPYDFIKITPAHIELLKATLDENDLTQLTNVLVLGGEAIHAGHFDYFVEKEIDIEIVNEYGPTEATVGCSTYNFHTISNAEEIKNGISIGRPIDNVELYVIGKSNELLPIGVPGEICIAGAGLSRGYLGKPELTAEKFVTNVFRNDGSSMYKTGDIGRWLPNGNLEYLGRSDDQVKIRGYRVEPGEIESIILQSGLVRQAIVVPKQDALGNKRLVAYYVNDQFADMEAINEYVASKLPDYMVPALWVELESLPLTTSGKVDKKALPEVNEIKQINNGFVAAETELEMKLAEVWQDLLEVENIGVHDDFFKLGGDSLLAIRLISSIRKKLEVEVDINFIFEFPTIAALSQHIQGNNKTSLVPSIKKVLSRPSLIPLSYSQERLWFMDQMEGTVEYHTPAAIRLHGHLNVEALEHSLKTIVDRHEVLRTVFEEHDGQPFQYVKEAGNWYLSIVEGDKFKNDSSGLRSVIEDLISKPFDLSRDHMLRANLIKLSEAEHVLVVVMHHIASDAWSIPIIIKELAELYSSFVERRSSQLLPLQLQYADYAIWQRNLLTPESLEERVSYWKDKLADVAPLQLPTDFKRPAVRNTTGAACTFEIDEDILLQLHKLSQQESSSLYMVLLSVFKVLLYRYSGQQDISVGTSIANRTQQEVEGLIGFFVNTLAFRDEVRGDATFLELLRQVRATTLGGYEHQEVSFEKVVEAVVKERDPSISPLFQVMLVLQNTPEAPRLELGELSLSGENFQYSISKFDLTFFINEHAGGLKGLVQYRSDLFKAETIERMMSHFKQLLASVTKNPDQQVGLLGLLTESEQQQLLVGFNQGEVVYPKGETVVSLFEQQVREKGHAVALVCGDKELTYEAFNSRSNQLAHYLRSKGVKEDGLVGLYVERSVEMLVGIMGILKAGGAYVPIDPDFPADRISYMLEDSGCAVVISSKESRSRLELSQAQVEIIEIDGAAFNGEATTNPVTALRPDHLAYVIYTSGSTGQPKGVMIEHRHLLDYVFGLDQQTQIRESKSYALVSTIATDLGNTVIYSSLLLGGALHVFSKEQVSNIEYLHDYFENHQIDCVKIVPSHWKALRLEEELLLPRKLLVFGGEALPSEVVEDIRHSGSLCKVVNHYGPTETTIGKLLHGTGWGQTYDSTIPIGKPFSNTRVYVLSKELQLTPVGVAGQLYIAGQGVARGYLNNQELTRQKFIPNPYNRDQGDEVMYATGDLVKYQSDGNIQFIGRVDDQVKIRGYRVELGEIESLLQQSSQVSQAVVVAREDKQGNKRLIGYVVASEESLERERLMSYLKEKLPEYMIPSVVVELEELPLTANGKVNRKALPDPEAGELLSGQYVAPRTATEGRLAEIWQDVLEEEQVGVNDDFFELGGHSLLAVRLVSAIRKAFSVEIPISHVFDYPTIARLAEQLEQPSDTVVLPSIEVIRPRPSHIPLSFSQERLWFIDRMEGSLEYHVPAVLSLKGDLNIEALERALRTIVNRHEVLRTVIIEKDGQPYQHVKDKDAWQLTIIDWTKYERDHNQLMQYTEELINLPFDLSQDDMIRGHLIRLGEQDAVLVLTTHHIASDGWSRSILVKELVVLYKAYCQKYAPDLPSLPLQFADYAIWQRKYLNEKVLNEKLLYWKQKLEDVAPLQLPTDFVRPSIQSTRGATTVLVLNKDLSAQLQMLSQQQGSTVFMTLLATFNVLLHRYTGQTDICVGGGIAGRSQHEVEQLIGFFVNMLTFRTKVNSDISFAELLSQVKETTLEAYSNQEVPFEKVVDTIVTERDLSRNPLFQVTFILQNTPEVPKLQLGDVEFLIEEAQHTTSKFDLTFSITEVNSELEVLVEYCTDLFKKETIVRMLEHFKQLLASVVREPKQKIRMLEMLTGKEQNQILKEFNKSEVDYSKDKTIVDLFEEQVARTLEKTALVFDRQEITYGQLNEQSNQLANYLQAKGVKEEVLVPICIERSLEMIIGILGILKAGGAYVPVDPAFPEDRIKYIFHDTSASIALCGAEQQERISKIEGVEIVTVDERSLAAYSKSNPLTRPAPHNLAYIIYTSGSTGRPKGAMIEHKSVVSLIKVQTEEFRIGSDERILQFSNYSFDASVEQIFLALFNGASLFLIPEGLQLETRLFETFIKENKITHLHATPSFLVALDPDNYTSLKRVIAGGDLCKKELAEKWKSKVDFYNEYGPTETTVTAIEYLANTDENEDAVNLPIGKPLPNVSAYIVDKENNICPVGVPGELFIGGVQAGRGYLNRPDLTAGSFVPDTFNISNGGNGRLYKTGDFARWLSDGNIEFLGRIDTQVKIRGYRIEIGEIENVLQESGIVNEAAVIAKSQDDGNMKLLSYFVPNPTMVKEKEVELYEKQVLNWNTLYNTEYLVTKQDDSVDLEFDIIGWNDSFTGLPIPAEQMRYWLKDIVDVIFSDQPQNVLEIGCGTGLIYYQLAGKINKYIGTDFSRSSVAQIQNWINKGLKDYGNTELHVCAAHEVSVRDEEQIDTVIINSVVQYFPGQDYMTNVIRNSIKALKGKGRIIIGDVRDYRLLEPFKDRLYIEKFQHTVPVKDFKWTVQQDVLKEEELCFSPDYFYHLQSVFPEITHVNIQWKNGFYSNELSLYRYNVVIYVGEQLKLTSPQWQNWKEFNKVESVKKELEVLQPIIALKDVPNPRLWRERALNRSLSDNKVSIVGDLLRLMDTQDEESKSIDELIKLAEKKGYSYKLLVNNDPYLVNIVLEQSSSKYISQPFNRGNSANTNLTNIPLFSDIIAILQKDIKGMLRRTLPDYMIPSDYVAVSHLPLTSNGKVDRKFLAQREERGVANSQNYHPPVTEVEKKLVNIWSDLLGIDRIGIHDNFFELGGHSLLAIRVIAAIREEWDVELLVKDIFEYAKVSEMSKYIEIQLNIYTLEDDSAEFEIVTL